MKFADDTALLSLLQCSELDHGCALHAFVKWCDDNLLDLYVLKSKELIIDFRQNKHKPKASITHGVDVQIISRNSVRLSTRVRRTQSRLLSVDNKEFS